MLKNFGRASSGTEDFWVLGHHRRWFIYSSHQWNFTDGRPWLLAGVTESRIRVPAVKCGQSVPSAGICKPLMHGRPPLDLFNVFCSHRDTALPQIGFMAPEHKLLRAFQIRAEMRKGTEVAVLNPDGMRNRCSQQSFFWRSRFLRIAHLIEGFSGKSWLWAEKAHIPWHQKVPEPANKEHK